MNNETINLTKQEKELNKNSTEGPVADVVGLSAKGTGPNRRARRNANNSKRGLQALNELISFEERAFRNRKKKLAKQSKKRNR